LLRVAPLSWLTSKEVGFFLIFSLMEADWEATPAVAIFCRFCFYLCFWFRILRLLSAILSSRSMMRSLSAWSPFSSSCRCCLKSVSFSWSVMRCSW